MVSLQLVALLGLLVTQNGAAFTTSTTPFGVTTSSSFSSSRTIVAMSATEGETASTVATGTSEDTDSAEPVGSVAPIPLNCPLSFEQMVRQAALAVQDAYAAGKTRQTIRVLLPRDPSNGQIGEYFESDAQVDTGDLILAPPDESWQGGIMQLYRSCAPTCEEILRCVYILVTESCRH